MPVKKTASASGRKARRKAAPHQQPAPNRRWSARVTQNSNALDLEPRIFRSANPKRIARSLKRSAEQSSRRKGTPFQSAMSMLNFYLNRAGRHLSAAEKKPLEKAKDALRELFHRPVKKKK